MVRRVPELAAGFAVIIVAVLFLVYALRGAGEVNTGGYPLQAQFGSVGALSVGADVKIGGVVVGHVAAETLNPTTYAAQVKLAINSDIKVPEDSSASITSDSLLGGSYISISPGGSNTMMKPGASFQVTQSAVNLEDLLGKFIFSMGNGGGAKSSGQGSGQSNGQSGAQGGTAGASAPAQPSNPMALSK
ncbi:outer membrane lipid asymmetry maintenance protein MlaD [Acidocella facilis]|uniref:outer membrane lipid asymmetry maintenance protein MlaD n=1 Tax=Acidocella facilis TaxID=525 RepID=UPI000690A52D|nr:outer membrane lipid asymmetry maintenance protein MlaD [Acidocella facilis]